MPYNYNTPGLLHAKRRNENFCKWSIYTNYRKKNTLNQYRLASGEHCMIYEPSTKLN